MRCQMSTQRCLVMTRGGGTTANGLRRDSIPHPPSATPPVVLYTLLAASNKVSSTRRRRLTYRIYASFLVHVLVGTDEPVPVLGASYFPHRRAHDSRREGGVGFSFYNSSTSQTCPTGPTGTGERGEPRHVGERPALPLSLLTTSVARRTRLPDQHSSSDPAPLTHGP